MGFRGIATVAAVAGTLSGGALAQDNWPSGPITMVAGFPSGGGTDRFVREMSEHFAAKLGVPVNVVNKGGAGSQLGAMYFLQRGDDCETLFGSNISPYLQLSMIQNGAPYTLDDFAFINGQWGEYDLMFVSKESQYTSFEELMTAIKDRPGEVSAAMVTGGSPMLNLSLTLDSLGIPLENVNIVSFSSGAKIRTTVAGNTADFTIIAGEGSVSVEELIRPLAVYRTEPVELWDAPTIGSVVTAMGGEPAPILDGSLRGFAASAACREAHPDRFDKIVSAMKAAVEDPEVRKTLAEKQIGADWIGPEGALEVMEVNYDLYDRFRDRLSE